MPELDLTPINDRACQNWVFCAADIGLAVHHYGVLRRDVFTLLDEVERLRDELDQALAQRDDALSVLADLKPDEAAP